MIKLLDVEKLAKESIPVTSADFTIGKTNKLHPEGLFSEVIFGAKDTPDRRTKFSVINLHCRVLHPALVSVLSRLNKKLMLAIQRDKSYRIDENGNLVEDPDGEVNGITYVYKNFKKLVTREGEEGQRADLMRMFLSYYEKGQAFVTQSVVIPAVYRDVQEDEVHGGLRISPINDYYVNIIRLSIQLESLSSDVSSIEGTPLFEILSAKMQYLVNELYDFLIKKVSKKQGIVRKNILAKRADFSARAVISGGASEIRPDELGIPFRIMVKLYEPFILYELKNAGNVDQKRFAELLKEYNGATLSVPSIRALLTEVYKDHKMKPELENILWGATERAIEDKIILAKRDPSLHAESVQGFKPKLIKGNTIKLPIIKCSAYNADFDGDQMALYTPITKEAIEEARRLMITPESKDGVGQLADEFNKDMVIGLYILTQDSKSKATPKSVKNDKDLDKLKPTDLIIYDGEVTTAGRVIFNKIVPAKKFHIKEPLNKNKINGLTAKIYEAYKEKPEVYNQFMHDAVELGMKYYTISPTTFSLDDLVIPKSILALKPKLEAETDPAKADLIIRKMETLLIEHLDKSGSPLGIIGKAGGLKGGYNQVRQILVSKGLVQSLDGTARTISHSYSDGLSPREYFESGFGSRQGIVDRVLNTAETGYMSRQFVNALQRVEVDPNNLDCRTKKTVKLKVTPDIAKRLSGRFIVEDGKIKSIGDPKKYIGQVISLRSPMYCKTTKMCHTCYGDLMFRNKTRYVGVLAGQIFGERLTQTIMKTFHVGGSVTIKTIDIIDELSRTMSETDKNVLKKNFTQKESLLIAKTDGEIVIDFEDFLDQRRDIQITDDKVVLAYAYFKLHYLGYIVDVTIDNKVEIDLKDVKITKKDKRNFVLRFDSGATVLNAIPTQEQFSEQLKVIRALLSGKSPWKSGDHFLMKVYDIYHDLTGADFVHFEVLSSNLLRDKGNPSYPARLNPDYNPTVSSLKKIPQLESWLQSFNFENPKQSISVGLLYDRPKDETILERLVTGNF